jgi:hypothetical protein
VAIDDDRADRGRSRVPEVPTPVDPIAGTITDLNAMSVRASTAPRRLE